MKKTITLVILFGLFLTACGNAAATEEAVVVPTEDTSVSQAEEQPAEPEPTPEVSQSEGSDIVLEQAQFVYGVFQLEESDLAVTADQANTLLPLLTSLQELTSVNMGGGRPDNNNAEQTAPDENAVQEQQEQLLDLMAQVSVVLTPEQLESINSMDITQEIMQAVMEKYGVEMAVGGPGQGGPGGNGEQPAQGGDAQQGTPPEGGQGGNPPAGDADETGQGMNPGGRGGMNVSSALLEALIQLIQERAGV